MSESVYQILRRHIPESRNVNTSVITSNLTVALSFQLSNVCYMSHHFQPSSFNYVTQEMPSIKQSLRSCSLVV